MSEDVNCMIPHISASVTGVSKMKCITCGVKEAIAIREAVPGMPCEGPYPTSVGEVADELVEYVRELDSTCARGLMTDVVERLNAVLLGNTE